MPWQSAEQAPPPQLTFSPVQVSLPHCTLHDPSVQLKITSPQASFPASHTSEQAYNGGQTTSLLSHASTPLQWISQAQSGGHSMVVSLHWAAPQSMTQTF